jgi:phage virion morphogenesis protein
MAGAKISVNFDEVRRKLGPLTAGVKRAILVAIGDRIAYAARAAFESESTPEGAAWPALSEPYGSVKAKLFPNKPILQRRGTLQRSIFSEVQGDTVVIGSPLVYAAIHQWGGKAGRKLAATIPARAYLPTEDTAEEMSRETAEEVMAKKLQQAGLE